MVIVTAITQMGAAVAAGNLAMWVVSGRSGTVARALQRPHLGPYSTLQKAAGKICSLA